MDWQSIINDGNITMVGPKGIYPNRLAWLKDNPRIGAVVVFQSQTDFALGKAGLDHIIKAKATGHLDEAYVLLLRASVNGRPQFINAAPVEEIAARLHKEMPREGQWGPFWWLPAGLTDPDEMPWMQVQA